MIRGASSLTMGNQKTSLHQAFQEKRKISGVDIHGLLQPQMRHKIFNMCGGENAPLIFRKVSVGIPKKSIKGMKGLFRHHTYGA